MKINRYLLTANVIFFIFLAVTAGRINVLTKTKENEFKEAYKNLNTGGTLEYLKVMEYTKGEAEDLALVFYVENLTMNSDDEEGNGSSVWQIGRMVKMIEDKNRGDWFPVPDGDEIYWDSNEKKGNRFTFPPYVGKDISILLTK